VKGNEQVGNLIGGANRLLGKGFEGSFACSTSRDMQSTNKLRCPVVYSGNSEITCRRMSWWQERTANDRSGPHRPAAVAPRRAVCGHYPGIQSRLAGGVGRENPVCQAGLYGLWCFYCSRFDPHGQTSAINQPCLMSRVSSLTNAEAAFPALGNNVSGSPVALPQRKTTEAQEQTGGDTSRHVDCS
jgi:hypothetical protein